MKWSKSKLKCFRECPYKWKLTYKDNIRIFQKHEDLDKGIKLHELFDKFYLAYKGDVDAALLQVQDELGFTQEFIKKYYEHIKSFKSFNADKLKRYGSEDFMPLATEQKVETEEWTGIIDRVDQVKGNLILIDYKTSTGNSISDYFDELCLYSWLYEQKHCRQIDYVGIFFTGNNSLVIERLDRELFKSMLEDLTSEKIEYEKAIEQERFPVKPGFYCRWCSYKDTKHCTEEMREERTWKK